MDLEDLRLAVYGHFARTGRAPAPAELAQWLGVDEARVSDGLHELDAQHHLVVDAETGRIVMAHPFAAIPLGFSVMGPDTLWWGGCAWDSFTLPHLLPGHPEVLVATRCPACGTALAWVVGSREPPSGPQVAHFLTPVARIWDNVVRSCGNQRLFCNEDCVDQWLRRTGNARGYVLDLAALWRLASHWYEGRLERGYQRRDVAASQAYFASVGLSGPFWGLT